MIDHDLPCVACEYNLRGLSPEGRCPECGNLIIDSINRIGNDDPPSLIYRLVRLAVITISASAWLMGIAGCWLIGPQWSNWTPKRILGSEMCAEATFAFAVTALVSLALLVAYRRARKDRVIWFCLVLSFVGAWWAFGHALRVM